MSLKGTAYYQRARAYEKLDEKQKAILDWTEYLRDSAFADVKAYVDRGNLYRDLGDKENAINDYKVADEILQQYLNGVFGNGHMESINENLLDQVRTELSKLGVSLPAPQLTTANILRSIAKTEVERALNLAKFTPQNPRIQDFDAQLQVLDKQLANTQPQPYEGTVESLISNAAYEKMEALKLKRSQVLKKVTLEAPPIALIDSQIKQLEALIRRNEM